MFDAVIAFVLSSALCAAPPPANGNACGDPGRFSAAAAPVFLSRDPGPLPGAARLSGASDPDDSLKNGAWIGAVVGGVAAGLLAAVACGLGGLMSSEKSGCAGEAIAGAGVGAGLGALAGAGIDALFERAPHPAGGRRVGVRVRIRF